MDSKRLKAPSQKLFKELTQTDSKSTLKDESKLPALKLLKESTSKGERWIKTTETANSKSQFKDPTQRVDSKMTQGDKSKSWFKEPTQNDSKGWHKDDSRNQLKELFLKTTQKAISEMTQRPDS